MKKMILSWAAILAFLPAAIGETLTFKGETDKNPLAYKVGEKMTFTVSLVDKDPPSGEMVLYRNLKGPKKLTAKQNMGHGAIYGVETKVYTFKGDLE